MGGGAEKEILVPANSALVSTMQKLLELQKFDPSCSEATVVAGYWCFIGNFSAETVSVAGTPKLFESPDQLVVASDESAALAMGEIRRLQDELNIAWNTDYSDVFWNCMLGSWVIDFVQLVIERYLRLKKIIDDRDCPFSVICDVGDIQGFDTSNSFWSRYQDQSFNAFICARILKDWQPANVELAGLEVGSVIQPEVSAEEDQTPSLLNAIHRLLPFEPGYGHSTLGSGLLSLVTIICKGLRKKERRKFELGEAFEKTDGLALPFSMPKLINDFLPSVFKDESRLRSLAPRWMEWTPTVNHVRVYGDEGVKYRVAKARERGVWTGFRQHGGFYGYGRSIHLGALVEYTADRFYSWGWKSQSPYPVSVTPCPPPEPKTRQKGKKRDDKVIFVTNPLQLTCVRITSTPQADDAIELLEERFETISILSKTFGNRFVYRPFFDSVGSVGNEAWCRENFPSVAIADGTSLHDTLQNCSLAIMDAPSTTFALCMAWNVPTIGFWKPDHWALSSEAKKLFGSLFAVGIAFDSGAAAAAHATEISGSENAWWQSAEVQRARREWIAEFAAPGATLLEWALTLSRDP